jgi:hypothetical protein
VPVSHGLNYEAEKTVVSAYDPAQNRTSEQLDGNAPRAASHNALNELTTLLCVKLETGVSAGRYCYIYIYARSDPRKTAVILMTVSRARRRPVSWR